MPYRPFRRPAPATTAIRRERPPLRLWHVLAIAVVGGWLIVVLIVALVAAWQAAF
jgi:Tfp pilus assembly protein PilN